MGGRKKALSQAEWETRLKGLANGEPIGRGQHPPTGTATANKIKKITSCRLTVKKGSPPPPKLDLFGNVIPCTCGYHTTVASTRTAVSSISLDSEHKLDETATQPKVKILDDGNSSC